MHLYEIANSIACLFGEADDELAEDVAQQLEALEMAFEKKAENILQYRAGLLAEQEALKAESQRLKQRADALDRKAEWMKSYLHSEMQKIGLQTVKTLTFSARVCKSPIRIELEDGKDIPAAYQRIKTTVDLDKVKAMDDYKSGKTLPEELTIQQGTHLKVT